MKTVLHNNHNNSKARIRKLQHECEQWRKRLDGLSQENINLKNLLSGALNEGSSDARFLDAAEEYLNQFIHRDEVIGLLRYDMVALEKLLKNAINETTNQHRIFEQRGRKMRRELHMLEATYIPLKDQFNNFLGRA